MKIFKKLTRPQIEILIELLKGRIIRGWSIECYTFKDDGESKKINYLTVNKLIDLKLIVKINNPKIFEDSYYEFNWKLEVKA